MAEIDARKWTQPEPDQVRGLIGDSGLTQVGCKTSGRVAPRVAQLDRTARRHGRGRRAADQICAVGGVVPAVRGVVMTASYEIECATLYATRKKLWDNQYGSQEWYAIVGQIETVISDTIHNGFLRPADDAVECATVLCLLCAVRS